MSFSHIHIFHTYLENRPINKAPPVMYPLRLLKVTLNTNSLVIYVQVVQKTIEKPIYADNNRLNSIF